jgi:hypothetical protein
MGLLFGKKTALLRSRLTSDHIENMSCGVCLATVVNTCHIAYSVHVTICFSNMYQWCFTMAAADCTSHLVATVYFIILLLLLQAHCHWTQVPFFYYKDIWLPQYSQILSPLLGENEIMHFYDSLYCVALPPHTFIGLLHLQIWDFRKYFVLSHV